MVLLCLFGVLCGSHYTKLQSCSLRLMLFDLHFYRFHSEFFTSCWNSASNLLLFSLAFACSPTCWIRCIFLALAEQFYDFSKKSSNQCNLIGVCTPTEKLTFTNVQSKLKSKLKKVEWDIRQWRKCKNASELIKVCEIHLLRFILSIFHFSLFSFLLLFDRCEVYEVRFNGFHPHIHIVFVSNFMYYTYNTSIDCEPDQAFHLTLSSSKNAFIHSTQNGTYYAGV